MPPGAVVCAVGDVHGRLDLLEPALAALFRIRQEAWDAGKSFAAVLLASGGSSVQVLIGLLPIAVVAGICATALAWRTPRAETLAPH